MGDYGTGYGPHAFPPQGWCDPDPDERQSLREEAESFDGTAISLADAEWRDYLAVTGQDEPGPTEDEWPEIEEIASWWEAEQEPEWGRDEVGGVTLDLDWTDEGFQR